MMSSNQTATTFPALGFDPAQGKVGTIEELADKLRDTADKLGQAETAMSQAGRGGSMWSGQAAENFSEKVVELPRYLTKAHSSLGDAARVLGSWSSDLYSLQVKRGDFEARAAAALQSLGQAKQNPDLGLTTATFPEDQLQHAQDRYDAARHEVEVASQKLERIRDDAKRLLSQLEELAHQVQRALKRAAEEAPEEPGFWDRIGDAFDSLAQGAQDLAKKTWQWVKDHADVIAKVGDVLSDVGSVVSVLSLVTAEIPYVGAAMMIASVAINGAALGTHALAKAAGANVSTATLVFDGIGMIPGGGAVNSGGGAAKVLFKIAPKIFKEAKAAEGILGFAAKSVDIFKSEVKTSSKKLAGGAMKIVNTGRSIENKLGEIAIIDGKDLFAEGKAAKEVISRIPSTVSQVVAATAAGTAKKILIGTGIDAGENVAKDVFNDIKNGKIPSATDVFKSALEGISGK
jgi:ElaB/YqjD/DUF883 family membrane-anchored ribosome-binding protein